MAQTDKIFIIIRQIMKLSITLEAPVIYNTASYDIEFQKMVRKGLTEEQIDYVTHWMTLILTKVRMAWILMTVWMILIATQK